MEVSLTLIQTFYTVVQHGSYSAASRSLGLSYQTAANHVRRLEQAVGGKLVESEKGSRQVTVTPRGRRLHNLLYPELDAMLQRLESIVRQERPIIRAGIPAAIFYFLLPSVLKKFRDSHPDVEIQVYERDTVLADLIKTGGLDICMSEHYFGDSDVPQHLLGKYSLSLVHPISWGSSLCVDDFSHWGRDKPFITYEPGQTLRNAAINFLGDVGIDPTIAVTMSSGLSILRCVEAGLGYSIVPDWLLPGDDVRSEVRAIPLPDLPRVNLYFGYAGFLADNTHVRDLHDICRTEFVNRFSS